MAGKTRQNLESRVVDGPRQGKGRGRQQSDAMVMEVDEESLDHSSDKDEGDATAPAAEEAQDTEMKPAEGSSDGNAAASNSDGVAQAGVLAPNGTGQVGKKQPADTSGGAAAKRAKAPATAKDEDWCFVTDCGGDGCCFYNCFAAAYGMQKDKLGWGEVSKVVRSRGRTVRGEIAEFIEKRQDRIRDYFAVDDADLDEETQQRLEDGCAPTTWPAYLSALRRPNR